MEMMGTVRQEPIVAKKIYLHRNGLKRIQPKMIVVNERQIRDFSTFLNRVTSGIKAPIAVRNIYTPIGGSRVQTLKQLESGKHYVAGGNEHFKKMKYDKNSLSFQSHTQKQPLINKDLKVESSVRAIQATSRFRNLPEKPYLIHVFRNGDALFKGVRVLIPRRLMNSWEHVLELVTDKVELTLPAKRLCTLEGQVIHAVTDIKDGDKYVALEGARRFVKLPYCGIDPIPKLTSNRKHQIRTHKLVSTIPSTETTMIQTTEAQPKIKRLMPIKQHKGVVRPFGGRKNKAARNRALRDAQTDSAFGTAGQSTMMNTSIISEEDSINNGTLDDTHNLSTTMDTSADSVKETNNNNNNNIQQSIVNNEEEGVVEEQLVEETDIEEKEEVFKKKDTETIEVIEDEFMTVNEGHDDLPTMILNNNNNNVITEMQGQALNETVDLSLARKNSKIETTVVSSRDAGSKPPSQSNSKLHSKSNTPLNSSKSSLVAKSKTSLRKPTTPMGDGAGSKTSLVVKSKTSLRNPTESMGDGDGVGSKTSLVAKSKTSMRNPSRSTSKHSTRTEELPKTPLNEDNEDNIDNEETTDNQ